MELEKKVDKLNKIVSKAIMANVEELEEAILPTLAKMLVAYVEMVMPTPTEEDKEYIQYNIRSYGKNNEPVLLAISYDLMQVLKSMEQSGVAEWELNTIITTLPHQEEPTEKEQVH